MLGWPQRRGKLDPDRSRHAETGSRCRHNVPRDSSQIIKTVAKSLLHSPFSEDLLEEFVRQWNDVTQISSHRCELPFDWVGQNESIPQRITIGSTASRRAIISMPVPSSCDSTQEPPDCSLTLWFETPQICPHPSGLEMSSLSR